MSTTTPADGTAALTQHVQEHLAVATAIRQTQTGECGLCNRSAGHATWCPR